jgi:hypothetical protein
LIGVAANKEAQSSHGMFFLYFICSYFYEEVLSGIITKLQWEN